MAEGAGKRYTADHEWVRLDADGTATVGITDVAQERLGELVFVEAPEAGRALKRGDEAGAVESVKAASEVYAPISGEVVEANPRLAGEPGLVNSDAEGEGWLFRMRPSDPSEIEGEGTMDRAAYERHAAESA